MRPTRLTGLSIDVTRRKRAEEESRARLDFEMLIADLSSRFIDLPASDVDREIEDVQRRVCEVHGLDLSALWEGTAAAPLPLTLTHFYSADQGLVAPMRGMSAGEHFPGSRPRSRPAARSASPRSTSCRRRPPSTAATCSASACART